jgi:LemA protein
MLSVEAYPQIKANENVMQLQRSLNEVEEQLSAARRAYNQAVTDYNNAIEMFPNSILANYMKYERKMIFAVSQNERKNPNVKDLFEK